MFIKSIYFNFRYCVLYFLPGLRFLDSRSVTHDELSIALTKGEFTNVIRPVCIIKSYYLKYKGHKCRLNIFSVRRNIHKWSFIKFVV